MSVGLIVLRSTDSGAPVLSGTNGTLCAVLDWALAQKGWTTVATGTNAHIYKTAAGNGYCLYAAHDSAISGGANYATLRGCEATSTLSALVNPFPSVAQVGNAAQRVMTSSVANSNPMAYVIYLTDRFVRMLIQNGSNASWTGFQFGDLYGTQAGDAYATIMSAPAYGSSATAMDVNGSTNIASSYGCAYAFARDISGTIISTSGANGLIGNTLGTYSRATAARAGYMNRLVREKMPVDCSGSSSWLVGGQLPVGPTAIQTRGWIPNWWAPLHNGWGALTNGDTFTDSAYNPSAVFRMYGYASTNGWSFNEESDTWSVPIG